MEISKKNPKEIIKGYEGLYQKRILLDNITKEDIEIGKKEITLNTQISFLNRRLDELNKKCNELNNFSKKVLHPLKTRKEKGKIEEEIENIKKQLQETQEKLKQLRKRSTEISTKSEELEKDLTMLPECFTIGKKGLLTITNKSSKNIKNIDFSDSPSELMVHVTDYYPRNKTILTNYDGEKRGTVKIQKNGVCKECEALSHRNTVHFTINNVVTATGDGAGSWEQPKYVIIEPMHLHTDVIAFVNPSDSWTHGSLKLSNQTILLVNEEYIDELPEEAYKDYKVILYRGNYASCIQQAILSISGKLYPTDERDPVHAHSIERKSEKSLNYRNLLINYIRNNSYKGKEPISIKEEEIPILYDLMIQNPRSKPNIDEFYKLVKKYDTDENTLKFYYLFGFMRNMNKTFSLKNDKEMYDLFCNPESVDIEELDAIRQILKREEDKKHDKEEDNNLHQKLSELTIADLYKFENQSYAEYFFKCLEEITKENTFEKSIYEFTIKKDGKIEFCINMYDGINIQDIIDNNFSIQEIYVDHNYTHCTITSNRNMTAREVLTLINIANQRLIYESQMYTNRNTKQNNDNVEISM